MTGHGWVSIYRGLLEKSIWLESTPEQKTILITLLLMANHAPKKWEWKGGVYEVQAGEFITSLDSIAKKSGKGVSIQNVRTALKRFENLGFLTSESTNKNRLINIANWGFYQSEEGRANKQINKQLTSNQQAANKQLTTNNNVKNDKNEKNIYSDPDNKKKSLKNSCGEFKNVMLSDQELEKLKERFTHDWKDRIEKLSYYIESKGKRYKSHYATILSWARKEEQENQVSNYKQINTQLTNKKEIDDLEWDD